jgi:hypothetical protein
MLMDLNLPDIKLHNLYPNTRLHYLYRDGSNYKTGADVVLAGNLSTEQIDAIVAKLDDGEHFIPSQVGLIDLQPNLQVWDTKPSEDDHAWHALERDDIEATADAPTTELTAAELAAAFAAVEWDESDPSLPFDL